MRGEGGVWVWFGSGVYSLDSEFKIIADIDLILFKNLRVTFTLCYTTLYHRILWFIIFGM